MWGTSCKHVWQTKPIYIFQHILDYPAPQTRLNSNKLMNLWNQEPMGSWWILLQELMRQEPISNRLLIRVKLFLVNFYELSAILLAFLPTCRMRVFFAFKSIFFTVLQYLTIFPCVTHLITAGATHSPMFYWPRWKNFVSTVWTSVAVIWSTDLRVEKESLNWNVKPHYYYYYYY